MGAARLTSFLVKVASRCNLDCDYCYVYHHADQSWRSMPRVLSENDQGAFAARLAAYVRSTDLRRCAVILHGGEPLLAGVDTIIGFVRAIRAALPAECAVDIGLQTNGLLLTDEALDALAAADIAVSLSLDGPRPINDRHRTSRRGRSSFDRAYAALQRLEQRPGTFSGVIAVIDAQSLPRDVLDFFGSRQIPKLDFLLPDAHHGRVPPGRADDPHCYARWLTEAFDLWLDHYSHLRVRTFEALLDAAAGLPSGTDAFGLGDVSLLTIETDGSYHDLDVLKVVADGATRLTGTVRDTDIATVAGSDAIAAHRGRLRKNGLSPECQQCTAVDICGGGSLPHRYGAGTFDHPSVYCAELFGLIAHVKRRLVSDLAEPGPTPIAAVAPPIDMNLFEHAERSASVVAALWTDSREEHGRRLRNILTQERSESAESLLRLEQEKFLETAARPGMVAWRLAYERSRTGRAVYAIDGTPLSADVDYLAYVARRAARPPAGLRIGHIDPWLRAPFGNSVIFDDETTNAKVLPVVREALAVIGRWRPPLLAELERICGDVQFIRDPTAHPDKIVSFSDNSVPGALYVSVFQRDRLIDPYDLADSLIHEYRHQKLYLLERTLPMVSTTAMRVKSPWRDDLRPPSGLLHAIFVFVELRRFWLYVRDLGPAHLHARAVNQLRETDADLVQAFSTLGACPLTEAGTALAAALQRESIQDIHAVAA